MKLARTLVFVLGTAAASLCAAQTDPHSHPPVAAPAAAPVPADAAKPMATMPDPELTRMDAQIKAMQDMHARMMAAKTPAERKALMPGQMKLMQESMDMMNAMSSHGMAGHDMAAMHAGMSAGMPAGTKGGMPMHAGMAGGMPGGMHGDMAAHHQMMQKCMKMMMGTMQLMMDRMSAGG
jgi:hypothetical protein